jgi:hypothetical protein
MGYGAGLGATIGWANEASAGYFANPTHWSTFLKEGHKLKKGIVMKDDLHGDPYNLTTRRSFVTVSAAGSIERGLYDRQMGYWLLQSLGSNSTPTGSSSAGYTTNFYPGNLTGQSLSVQVGRPTSAGAMVATSYNGLKVTKLTIGVDQAQWGMLTVDTDAWNETVSTTVGSGQYNYVAPSWIQSNVLTFKGAALLLGGTASTTSAGYTTVSGNAAEVYCKDFTASHELVLDVSRFFVGGNGIKAEQIENGMRKITGNVKLEFANLTDVYTAMAADTPKALVFTFTGTSYPGLLFAPSLTITIPNVYWDEDDFHVDGAKILEQNVPFTGLNDQINNSFQVTTISADSAL